MTMPNKVLITIFTELWLFAKKQASACIFGGALIAVIIVTRYIDLSFGLLTRYDVIFISAIILQFILIATKLEHWREVKVIILFHIVATCMEFFKTHPSVGSWRYPETGVFMIATVPLFSGFMYSAVGSYIARAWRIFSFHFTHFPRLRYAGFLATAIYINFFTHHFFYDLRWVLFAITVALFWKTYVHFTIIKTPRSMPLLLGFGLVTFFIYLAENIATFTHTWLYPPQENGWQLVSLDKYGSWFLLMIISFVLVATIYRKKLWHDQKDRAFSKSTH